MARILVIDDDKDVRDLICAVLRDTGHHVVASDNGLNIENIHLDESLDLIITDILMPDFDGIEVIRKMRGIDPELRIIAISGGGWANPDQFLEMASRLGAVATFTKPFDWNKMLSTIDELTG